MRVGVTGHQRLDASIGWASIRRQVAKHVRDAGTPLIGLSSLAQGADQVFAQEILKLGGDLIAVLPFQNYRDVLPVANRRLFDKLLSQCVETVTLRSGTSNEDSYVSAGRYIVNHCDLLLAIWDGRPAAGRGGTGDVVNHALRAGRAVIVVDASLWRSNAILPVRTEVP